MTDDRRWMYRRRGPRGDCDVEFFNGLQQFFDFVYSCSSVHPNAEIRCPYSKCENLPHHNKATVTDHLLRYGFMDAYSVWWAHDETLSNNVDPLLAASDVASSSNIEEHVNAEDDFHHMVYDAFCPSENDRPRNETEFASENVGDAPNRHAQSFYELLHASTIPLGPSSNNQTLLEILIHLAQSTAWKHFDAVHPSFASDPQNVRLGLATDGFNPWELHNASHAYVDHNGFPQLWYGFWMEHTWLSVLSMTRAFYLQYGRKICFFDCHRQFLPTSHSYRMDATQFLKGRLEFGPPPPRLDGHFVRLRLVTLPDVLFGNPSINQTISGFGKTHN
ncbi:hypothetical protein SLE2022_144250 [Rubroshorea leprosula]